MAISFGHLFRVNNDSFDPFSSSINNITMKLPYFASTHSLDRIAMDLSNLQKFNIKNGKDLRLVNNFWASFYNCPNLNNIDVSN
jgi:hypothetical protein